MTTKAAPAMYFRQALRSVVERAMNRRTETFYHGERCFAFHPSGQSFLVLWSIYPSEPLWKPFKDDGHALQMLLETGCEFEWHGIQGQTNGWLAIRKNGQKWSASGQTFAAAAWAAVLQMLGIEEPQ